jgi:Protein of unknown function (DUF2892)
MGKKKKEEEPVEWKFFWKNVGGLGMILRIAAGIAFLAAAKSSSENPTRAAALGLMGVFEIMAGLCRWCPLRALRRKPTKRALKRHYPEAAEA